MTSTDALTRVVVPGQHLLAPLCGPRDVNVRAIESAFPAASIQMRGDEILIRGPESDRVGRLFEELIALIERGQDLDDVTLGRVIQMVQADERPSEVLTHQVLRGSRGRHVRPKTAGQKRYVDAIERNVITFGIGPAGTGKSLARDGDGGEGIAGERSTANHSDPACSRGRRAAWLFAW